MSANRLSAIVLLLLLAGQPAMAQESRGATSYATPPMLPANPGLDAEEAFRAGERRPLPAPKCDQAAKKCQTLIKYVAEYNRTLEALEHKYRQ
jgi:hypothetical protein